MGKIESIVMQARFVDSTILSDVITNSEAGIAESKYLDSIVSKLSSKIFEWVNSQFGFLPFEQRRRVRYSIDFRQNIRETFDQHLGRCKECEVVAVVSLLGWGKAIFCDLVPFDNMEDYEGDELNGNFKTKKLYLQNLGDMRSEMG